MKVGTCILEIYIKNARTLKDKRRILKSLIDRIKNKYNVSVAETNYNNNHKLAEISIAIVANEKIFIEKSFNKIKDFISLNPDVYISESEVEIW